MSARRQRPSAPHTRFRRDGSVLCHMTQRHPADLKAERRRRNKAARATRKAARR